MRHFFRYVAFVLVLGIFIPSISLGQTKFLVGTSRFDIKYKSSGSYSTRASVDRLENPLYEDISGATVRFVVANNSFAFGRNMRISTLASRYIGNMPARTYFTQPIKMEGRGQIRLADGTYRLCILFTLGSRIYDGITFSKKLTVRNNRVGIRAVGKAIEESTHLRGAFKR